MRKTTAIYFVEVDEFERPTSITSWWGAKDFIKQHANVFSSRTIRKYLTTIKNHAGRWFIFKEINFSPDHTEREVWFWVLPEWQGQGRTPQFYLILKPQNRVAEDNHLAEYVVKEHFEKLLPPGENVAKDMETMNLRIAYRGSGETNHCVKVQRTAITDFLNFTEMMSTPRKSYFASFNCKDREWKGTTAFYSVETPIRPVFILVE